MSRAVINKPHFETSTISSKWVYQNSVTEYYVPNLCKDTFYSGKETLSGKLGTSGFNSNFIKSCFSDMMLSLLKNQEISCSAVSLGDSVKGWPPTAQNAQQQGIWLAQHFNTNSTIPYQYQERGRILDLTYAIFIEYHLRNPLDFLKLGSPLASEGGEYNGIVWHIPYFLTPLVRALKQ